MNPAISKKETTQTAVDWFDKQLQDKMYVQYGYGTGIRKIVIPIDEYIYFKQQAKQMEKEQIMNAWRNGDNDSMYDPKELDKQAEQYYNETYNK